MCIIGRDKSDDLPNVRKTVVYEERPARSSRVSHTGSQRRNSRVYVEREGRNSNTVVYERRRSTSRGPQQVYEQRRSVVYDEREPRRSASNVVYEQRTSGHYDAAPGGYQGRRSGDVVYQQRSSRTEVEPGYVVRETRRIF